MKKPRLTEMKQFVLHPTTPSDRSRVGTEAVSLRVLLPLDYFRKMNRVETVSGHFGVKQDQGKTLPSLVTSRTRRSSPKEELGKQLSDRLFPQSNLEMDLSCWVSVLKAFSWAPRVQSVLPFSERSGTQAGWSWENGSFSVLRREQTTPKSTTMRNSEWPWRAKRKTQEPKGLRSDDHCPTRRYACATAPAPDCNSSNRATLTGRAQTQCACSYSAHA